MGLQFLMTAPNHLVITHYVSPHICLSVLSNLCSHLLTIIQPIPSLVGFHHMDLLQDFTNSGDDVIGLTVSPLSPTYIGLNPYGRTWGYIIWYVAGITWYLVQSWYQL